MQEKIDAAIDLISRYGQIDGSHHKQWVIDQVARVLLGKGYAKWIKKQTYEGGEVYVYDEGIAP